ncbi:hypothetical protein C0J52_27115 [Blattella germanica]|nr:hypothetical protein C0J52_27115 [Blattella germanica]
MRHLNDTSVARAVSLIEDGRSFRHVSRTLDVSPSVIHRLWSRYRETHGYKRRPGQGRKKKTKEVEDRFLVLSALRRRTSTARDLQNHLRTASGTVISDQTVRNRLRNARLSKRNAKADAGKLSKNSIGHSARFGNPGACPTPTYCTPDERYCKEKCLVESPDPLHWHFPEVISRGETISEVNGLSDVID